MRDRHIPRLCRSCRVPMARQEGTCWHCGAQLAVEERGDVDRWMNEGGSAGSEIAAEVRVAL